MPRAGHDVDRGDAAGARLPEVLGARVDGVEDAHVRVERLRGVAARAAAEVRVGVDQTGQHDQPVGIDGFRAVCRGV